MIKYSKKHFNSLYSDLNTINILDNSYILLYANNTKIYLLSFIKELDTQMLILKK